MSCIVFLIGVVVSLLWCYIRCFKFTYWARRGVVQLPPSFPFGNIKEVGRTMHSAELMKSVYEKYKGSGEPFVGLFYFTRPVALVTDLKLVQDILVRKFTTFNDRGVYSNEENDPLSAHLFSLEGEKWKDMRQAVSPLFTPSRIRAFHEGIWTVASRLRVCIGARITHHPSIDVSDLSARYIIDTIGLCVFGINPNALGDDNAPFRSVAGKIFAMSRLQMLRHLFLQSFRRLAMKFHMKLTKREVEEFFSSLNCTQLSGESFMKLLQQLQVKGKLSSNQVIAQSFIFFVAGFETSAITVSYCLHELAWNPSIQEKLRDEIIQEMQQGNKLSWDAINRMTLLNAVVNETLRKYPPGGNFLRIAKEDFEVAGKVIERDTLVVIPLYGIHRDEHIHPNPLDFNPHRPELIRHSCTFMPFGDGPRHCIGRRFALHQIKLVISVLLSHYRFSPAPHTQYSVELAKNTVLLSPLIPLHLNVEHLGGGSLSVAETANKSP